MEIKPITGIITERWQSDYERREQQARRVAPVYGRTNGREVSGREIHSLRRDKGGAIVGPYATREKSGLDAYGREHGNMDSHRASARELVDCAIYGIGFLSILFYSVMGFGSFLNFLGV